jgi:hypothetical protein
MGLVVLDELGLYAELGEGVAPVGLDQEAALVAVDGGRLDQDEFVELGLEAPEAHRSALPYWRS